MACKSNASMAERHCAGLPGPATESREGLTHLDTYVTPCPVFSLSGIHMQGSTVLQVPQEERPFCGIFLPGA